MAREDNRTRPNKKFDSKITQNKQNGENTLPLQNEKQSNMEENEKLNEVEAGVKKMYDELILKQEQFDRRQQELDKRQKELDDMVEQIKSKSFSSNDTSYNADKVISVVAKEAVKAGLQGINPSNVEMELSSRLPVDADDLLEKPVMFRCNRIHHVISHDIKNGRIIEAPHGLIVFTFEGTRIVPDSRNSRYQMSENFSRYLCISKNEYKFLREHAQYNIMFYEISDKGASVKKNVEYIVDASNKVNGMGREWFESECIQRGIDRSLPESQRRLILTEIYAKEIEDNFELKAKQKQEEYSKFIIDIRP